MRLLLVITLIVSALLFVFEPVVLGQSPTPTPDDESDESETQSESEKLKQIEELQSKINDLKGEQKTLSSQIEIMESQIEITELRIEETNDKIDSLGEDIGYTEERVGDLEEDILTTSKLLIDRVNAVHQVSNTPAWEIFLTSSTIDNFLTRLKYLKIVQLNDHKRLYAAEQARVSYEEQKEILEEKQEKERQLSAQLESYTDQLEVEKTAKDELLRQTKNSEAEYQKQLAAALAELRQIQQAAKILISEEPKDVSRGEPIGLMGSTGFSTGPHLHFGIYNISSLEDYEYNYNHSSPEGVLERQSVEWDTGCGGDPSGKSDTGSGSYLWPMDTGSLYITQGYGSTCWSWRYATNFHPAYDMVNRSNIVVKAVADGKAYFCRNCTGDGANGVFIFHDGGKMSLYWHLQ